MPYSVSSETTACNGSVVRYFSKTNSGHRDEDYCSVYKPDDDPFSFTSGRGISRQVRGPPVFQLQQSIEKRLEDERMEKKQTDSVQNRFTAYLMTAVVNKRISYMEQRNRQKEREREILFARGFGELDFTELGEKFGMEPKQAEMAYYYIIRKLRKGMGVRKDEF